MRRGERGKVGLGALVVCAAVGYVAWQWGVPWVDAKWGTPEVPPRNADANGVPETPKAPASMPTPGPTPSATPDPTPATSVPAAPTPPAAPSSTRVTDDPREAAARKLFHEAQNWELNQRYETAMAKYEELIEVYKGTQAAEEARPRLHALRSK